jgi:uncharacterized membrane protein YGL010W
MSTTKAFALTWIAAFLAHGFFLQDLGKWAFITIPLLFVLGTIFVGRPAIKFAATRSKS